MGWGPKPTGFEHTHAPFDVDAFSGQKQAYIGEKCNHRVSSRGAARAKHQHGKQTNANK